MTGTGVVVAIVDDGLETTHPDLSPNYAAADSWDFGQNDSNPSPVYPPPVSWNDPEEDSHGTSVAGVMAARGGNGTGTAGSAPQAGLAGLRVDFTYGDSADFADATLYHSSGSNTSIKIKNHSYGDIDIYLNDPAELAALAASASAGTLHVVAAGNDRGTTSEDANKQDLSSSPHAITVAALGRDGVAAYYSSFGACVFLTAPSSSGTGPGITTTDRTGGDGTNSAADASDGDSFPDLDYTSRFGGTSSSSPLVAGILALAKQARPALDMRLAKHLLARTCFQVDPNDSTVKGGGDGTTAGSAWKTNAAGFKFNESYGFGLIQADALVQQAPAFRGVTPLETETTVTITVGASIPDNNSAGVSRQFTLAKTTPLEEVLLTVDISHTFRGDLEIYLTSPRATTSRLAYRSSSDSGNNIRWTFLSNAFWGENPQGTWTVNVRDGAARDRGTWNSFSAATRMGTPIPVSLDCVVTGPPTANAGPVTFQAAFSAPVSDLSADGISVTNGTVTGLGGSGEAQTIQVTPGGQGEITCRVSAGAVQDSKGNPNTASNTAVTLFDSIPPVCTLSAPAASRLSPLAFNASFSEAVTGLTAAGISVTNGTLASLTGSGASYVISVTPAGQENVTCLVMGNAGQDAAGNGNAASDTATTFYDTTPPDTTIAAAPPDPSTSSSATFTFSSTDAGSTFLAKLDGDEFAVGASATITFDDLLPGTHVLEVSAVDPAGNTDPTMTTFTWTIPLVIADGIAPLLNPFDSPLFLGSFQVSALNGGVGWAVDASPAAILGAPSFATAPFSLNYNGGTDYETPGLPNAGSVVTGVIHRGALTTTGRLKFMCNHQTDDGAATDLRTVNVWSGDLLTLFTAVPLSGCAAMGTWHEHTLDLQEAWGPDLRVEFAFDTVDASNNIGGGWFIDDLEISDLLVSSLHQYPGGGAAAIPIGGTTTTGAIDFRGIVSRAAAGAVQLDIELKPVDTPFTGTPTASAAVTGTGMPIQIKISLPSRGDYHWQARTKALPSGPTSGWMKFGLNPASVPDFTAVSAPPSGSSHKRCGLLGLEALAILLLGALRRRATPAS